MKPRADEQGQDYLVVPPGAPAPDGYTDYTQQLNDGLAHIRSDGALPAPATPTPPVTATPVATVTPAPAPGPAPTAPPTGTPVAVPG